MPTLPMTPSERTFFYKNSASRIILNYLDNHPHDPITGEYGETMLHWAAFRGLLPLTEALLARGYDPNAVDESNQRTPLHWAAREYQKCNRPTARDPFKKIIKLLRQHSARINTRDHHNKSPLDTAEKKSTLRGILTTPAPLFDLKKRYNKALKEAISTNNLPELKKISAADLLAFKDTKYNNVLLLAARVSNVETFSILLKKLSQEEIDRLLSQPDYYNRNVIMLAAIANNGDMLDRLYDLKNSYDVVLDPTDPSAVTHAIKRNNKKALLILLVKYNIPLKKIDLELLAENKGLRDAVNAEDFLLLAVSSKNMSLLRYILRHLKTQPANIQKDYLSHANASGENPIMLAAKAGNKIIALQLVQLTNMDLTQHSKEGLSVLAYLLRYDCLDALLHILNNHPEAFNPENKPVLLENLQYLSLTGSNKTQTYEIRKKIADAFTELKHTFKGATSYFSNELIERKRRPYEQQRARQLLRQCATQIYLAAKKQKELTDLVEVQIMSVGKNLVIAVNPASLSKIFSDWLLQYKGNLAPLLSTTHVIKSEPGSKKWSSRHAAKLQHSLFGSKTKIKLPTSHHSPQDGLEAHHIAKAFKRSELFVLPALHLDASCQLSGTNKPDPKIFSERSGDIFILLIAKTPCAEMHAEEYLAILFNYLKQDNPNLTATIQGKKRPCLSCAATIESIGAAHNTRPGLFFRGYYNNAAPDPAAHRITEKFLDPQHITVNQIGGTQYSNFDTASDSEVEERYTSQGVEYPYSS